MHLIEASETDRRVLADLLAKGLPAPKEQPASYDDVVVFKPWGYEFQVFDNAACSLWLACLKPGEAVSLHCHRHKRAAFLPLSGGVTLKTFASAQELHEAVGVDKAVFHSQENNTASAAYFLEYEWPAGKTDLVRYQDRYGRASSGYEGVGCMLPLAQCRDQLQLPASIAAMLTKVA